MLVQRIVFVAGALALAACSGGWDTEQPSAVQGSVQGGPAKPSFGNTVTADDPPPPLSGGTLAASRDTLTVVAADPDRDAIYVADLGSHSLRATISLSPGDEPGRVTELEHGLFAVALRRGGALVVVDTDAGAITQRVPVCSAPRGVAYDADTRTVYVACVSGDLVSLETTHWTVTRTVHLASDLRDVVVDGPYLRVSTFRSARLLTVDASGEVIDTQTPRAGFAGRDGGVPFPPDAGSDADAGAGQSFDGGFVPPSDPQPSVAWRTRPTAGGAIMVHQMASTSLVMDGTTDNSDFELTDSTPYGGSSFGCGGIVQVGLTKFDATGAKTVSVPFAALPVDVAASHDGERIVVVAAGNARIPHAPLLFTVHAPAFDTGIFCGTDNEIQQQPDAQPIAATFDGNDRLLVQTREPAALYLIDEHQIISLSNVTREDTGYDVFHSNSSGGLACASCHPEGGDDGRVWQFSVEGARRTQNLRGGILGTEPFHWGGEILGVPALVTEVFVHRMGGPALQPAENSALMHWVDRIPNLPAPPVADPAAVERGRAIFNDPTVACASCHSGEHMTNNATVSVGTGAAFQVPRLAGLWARAPYLHDGCATTLRDRFGACGGGDAHGHTSQLTSAQLDDLIAYLGAL